MSTASASTAAGWRVAPADTSLDAWQAEQQRQDGQVEPHQRGATTVSLLTMAAQNAAWAKAKAALAGKESPVKPKPKPASAAQKPPIPPPTAAASAAAGATTGASNTHYGGYYYGYSGEAYPAMSGYGSVQAQGSFYGQQHPSRFYAQPPRPPPTGPPVPPPKGPPLPPPPAGYVPKPGPGSASAHPPQAAAASPGYAQGRHQPPYQNPEPPGQRQQQRQQHSSSAQMAQAQQEQWPWQGGRSDPTPLPVRITERTRKQVLRSNNPAPAYTAVKAPSPPSAQEPQPHETKRRKKQRPTENVTSWPEELKDYVMRSYQLCSTDELRDKCEKELKKIIGSSIHKGTMNSINWKTRPLPSSVRPKKSKRGAREPESFADQSTLQSRAARFQLSTAPAEGKPTKRARRGSKRRISLTADFGGDVTWDTTVTIRGTATALEKPFFRLTSAPEPSSVRPLHILKKALPHVIARWEDEKKSNKWICDQLKSLRQDLTIQCIRDEFTAYVYETHGRIALRHADSAEFNQCQAQLVALYGLGIPGCVAEFTAYRILYFIYTENFLEMTMLLSELSSELKNEAAVKHALSVQRAQSLGNYKRFFALYESAPNCGQQLMDLSIERERKKALAAMFKAYRPSLPSQFVLETIKIRMQKDGMKFIFDLGLPLTKDNALDCKQGATRLAALGYT